MADHADQLAQAIADKEIVRANKLLDNKLENEVEKVLKGIEKAWEQKLRKAVVKSVKKLWEKVKRFDLAKFVSDNIND